MQHHSWIMSCIVPLPVIGWLHEAEQCLHDRQPVCQRTTPKPNFLQTRNGAVEQGHPPSHIGEVLENSFQAGNEAKEYRSHRNRHNKNRQKWKATALDKNIRHIPPLDYLCPVALGKDSWPDSKWIDGSSHGSRYPERCAFQLLPRDSGTAYKPSSSRTDGSKEIAEKRTNVTPGLQLA